MINIDNRIFQKVDESEFWLLCHIAKRLNNNRLCWPSNKLLCKDTGWSMDKLQRIKKRLIDKGILKVIERMHPNGQGSNAYKMCTNLIGIYIPVDDIDPLPDFTPPLQNQVDPPPQNQVTEVLINEVLINIAKSKNTDESNKIDHQTALFLEEDNAIEDQSENDSTTIQDSSTEQKKPDCKKRGQKKLEKPPEYEAFVSIWCEEYPTIKLGANPAIGGKMIKELVAQTKVQLAERQMASTYENTIEFWQIFVKALKNTWANGADLTTINSKYPSLIYQIENGKGSFTQGKWSNRTLTERLINSL